MNNINSKCWAFAFLCLGKLFFATGTFATQSLWQGTTSTWATASNWSNGVPTGIAEFGSAGTIRSPLLSANSTLAQLLFDLGAAAYTINTNGKTLTLTTGITNNSAQTQIITNSTPTKSTLTFQSGALVGNNITINNVTNGSEIVFSGTSSATGTIITNAAGCTVDISTLAAATPSITMGSLSGAGAVTLGSKNLTTGALGLADTISGIISGAGGSLTKIGTGTLTLSGTNTYTGPTNISAGTLQMGKANSLSTGTAVTLGAETNFALVTFNQSIGSLAGPGAVELGTATLTTGNDTTNTFYSGDIFGTGGVTKVGTGIFNISGTNTYSGTTTINAGTLQAGNINTFSQSSAVSIAAAGTLDLNNTNQAIASLAGAGLVKFGSGTLFTGYANTSTTYSGVMSGTGGLTQAGTGTLTLSGINTYTGPTNINAGTLKMAIANGLSTSTDVTVASGAFFNLNNDSQSIGSLSGGGGVQLGSATLTVGNNNKSTTYSGAISGTGGLSLIGGTLTLSGTNTYTGATSINAGTLQGGAAGAFASTSAVTVAAGAKLDLNSFNQSIGSLAGAGNVTFESGKLTTGNATSTTYSGIMSGTGSLTKVGPGSFTISGNNIYTGGTTISAGTLLTGVANALPSSGLVTVTGTLTLNNNSQTISSLAGTGTVSLGSGTITTGSDNTSTTFSGGISGTGGFTKVGIGTFTLSGTNTYTGPTNISAGTLQMGKANSLSTGTAVTLGAETNFALVTFNQSIGSLAGPGAVELGTATLTTGNDTTNTFYSGDIFGTGGVTKVGTGIFNISGTNTYSGTTTINAGTLQAGNINTFSQSSAVSIAAAGTLDLNNTNQAIASLAGAGLVKFGSGTLFTGYANTSTTYSGVMSGTGGLTQAGTGTLTLSGINTYTGPTNINAGTLKMAIANGLSTSTDVTVASGAFFNLNNDSQSIGSLSGGGGVQLGSATLTVGNNNKSTTYSGATTGTGILSLIGGTLTLSGANAHTGGTIIQNGTLVVGADANIGATNKTLTLGTTAANPTTGTLQTTASFTSTRPITLKQGGGNFNPTGGTLTLSGIISGIGSLIQQGPSPLVLSGVNTFSGGTQVLGGTLIIAADDNLGAAGTTLTLGSAATAGTLQNSAAFASSRPIDLGQSGGVINTAGGTLTLSGPITGPGSLTQEGPNLLILSNPNNLYAGGTVINAGTLQTAVVNALPQTGAVTVAGGAIFNLNNFSQTVGGIFGTGSITFGTASLTTNISAASTFAGTTSGSGALILTGMGALTLTGANTHTGGTDVLNGTLIVGTDTNIGGAGKTLTLGSVATPGTLQTTGSFASARPVALGQSGGVFNTAGGTLTLSGPITGPGSLTQEGPNLLILSNPNNLYTGGTFINAGTLQTAVANALPQTGFVTIGAAGTLDLDGNNQLIGLLTGQGTLYLNNASLTINTNTASTFAGNTSGSGALILTNTGALTLTGTNTHTGGTNVLNGTLIVGADTNIGGAGATLIMGSAATAGTLQASTSFASSRPITLGQSGGIFNTVGGSLTLSGPITGPGSFTQEGPNLLILSNPNNLYAGGTFINAGTLQMAVVNALPQIGAVMVAGGAFFNLNNFNQSVGAISGGGDIIFGTGSLTSNNNIASSFSGNTSGSGGLILTNTGALTLTGTNTHTGGTNVLNGTIIVGADTNIGSVGTTLTLGSAATAGTLQTSAPFASNRPITLGQSGGIFNTAGGSLTLSGPITGQGSLTQEGPNLLILLNPNNLYTGGTFINAGTLQTAVANALPQTGTVTIGAAGTLDLDGNNLLITLLIGQGDLYLNNASLTTNTNTASTFAGNTSGSGALILTNTGALTLTGANTHTGGTNVLNGTLIVGADTNVGGAGATLTLGGAATPGTLQTSAPFASARPVALGQSGSVFNTAGGTLILSGPITGPGSLTQEGPNLLILSNPNNLYASGTFINAGTLQTAVVNTLPQTGAVTIGAAGTLDLDGYDQIVGSITGSGDVTLSNAILTTGGDDTNTTFSGNISGLGGLIKSGNGTLTLSGTNSYSGQTVINSGILQAPCSSIPGSVHIAPAGQLIFNQALTDDTFAGMISGMGTLVKQGPKTLILESAGPFMGTINIEAGTLLLNDAPPLPNHAGALLRNPLVGGNPTVLTIQPGSTLMGTGVINQAVVNNGLLSVGNPIGTGFETFTLMHGYQGTGTLQFNLDNEGNNSMLISDGVNIDLRQTSLSISTADTISSLQTYDLIQVQNPALGTILGPFQSIPNRLGKFVPSIAYNPDSVQLLLDLQATSFAMSSQPGNDRNVASYLDQLSTTSQGSLEQFIFQLENLTPTQRDVIFNQLNPAAQTTMTQSLGLGAIVVSISQGRMRNLGSGEQTGIVSGTPAAFTSRDNPNRPSFINSLTANQNLEPTYHTTRAALTEDNAYQVPFGKGIGGIWVQGFAISNQQKTTQGITGFGAKSGGLMTGVDAQLPKTNFYVGAAVGYGRGKVSFTQSQGTSKINSNLTSIYALYAPRDFYLDATLAFGYNKYQNNRQLPSLGLTAQSTHRGIEWTPHVGGGINFKLQEVFVQPFVNVDYLYLREGRYSEQNASFANLAVLSTSSSQWRGETGLNVSKTFSFPNGTWALLGKLSYIRRQPSKNSSITAGLVTQSTTFETESLSIQQNEISPGIGLKFNFKNGLFISGRYDAELSSVSTVQEIGIKLGYTF